MTACPFRVGDCVDVLGVCGTVTDIKQFGSAIFLRIKTDQGHWLFVNCSDALTCQHG